MLIDELRKTLPELEAERVLSNRNTFGIKNQKDSKKKKAMNTCLRMIITSRISLSPLIVGSDIAAKPPILGRSSYIFDNINNL